MPGNEGKQLTDQHKAFGKQLADLDIAVVEDSRSTQTILRSLLAFIKIKKHRIYDSPREAVPELFADPPDVILSDWYMKPVSGYQMLCLLRQPRMAPLTHVPFIFLTAHSTRSLVSKAMRAGAHHVLVKPLSANVLESTLDWVTRDERKMIPGRDGSFHVEGVPELLDRNEEKYAALSRAEEMHLQSDQDVKDRNLRQKAHDFASLLLHPDMATEEDEPKDARSKPATQQERSSKAFGQRRSVHDT